MSRATPWIRIGLVTLYVSTWSIAAAARERWSEEQANRWYAARAWPAGCNFTPSTASNQFEMWQADTFDPATIDRELGWAADLGFNSVRVFLHNLLWDQDQQGFLARIEQFLTIADKHKIRVVLVPLDGVWDPDPKLGPQAEPVPHRHNSCWAQAPGRQLLGDPQRHDELRPYIYGLVHHLRDDARIDAWDLFNEPDNGNPAYAREELSNKREMATLVVGKLFRWAREADPAQPLTVGLWIGQWPNHDHLSPIEKLSVDQSDIISFHSYNEPEHLRARVEQLRRYNRPILCTEYMARSNGSRFDPLLAYFKDERVGAYCWGFVAGRSQTIYPWDSWLKKYTAEPDVWFHDILRADGAPFDPAEVAYIKQVTGVK